MFLKQSSKGPPLTENLRRAVEGTTFAPYHPQTGWLALTSTGDKYAVASRGWLGFAGAWVWTWKDWIDRRFMAKSQDFPAMDADSAALAPTSQNSVKLSQEESLQAISAIAMRCGGCGAKVGATVLSRAPSNLHPADRDDVIIGLKDPDAPAVVRVPPYPLSAACLICRAISGLKTPYRRSRLKSQHTSRHPSSTARQSNPNLRPQPQV